MYMYTLKEVHVHVHAALHCFEETCALKLKLTDSLTPKPSCETSIASRRVSPRR